MPAEPAAGARRPKVLVWAALALAAALAGVLVSGLVGGWPLRRSEARPPVPAPEPQATDPAAEASPPALASPAGSAVAAAALAASATDTEPDCPPEWKAMAGMPPDAVDQAFERVRPAALKRAAGLLAASGDPFERLVAGLLADRANHPDAGPSAEAFLAVVSEALASQDPRVAGLAAELCRSPSVETPAACSSLTPERWAQVDPDNVQPWLAMAGKAQDEGDVATVRSAMARAAQASQSRLTSASLVQLAGSPLLKALTPVERQALVLDLVGASLSLGSAGTLDAVRLCPSGTMGPQRQAQCSAVAGLLVVHGENLLQHGVGIAIGRRAGWDAERVAALAAEQKALLDAYATAMQLDTLSEDGSTVAEACRRFRQTDEVVRRLASADEMTLARAALAPLGPDAGAAARP